MLLRHQQLIFSTSVHAPLPPPPGRVCSSKCQVQGSASSSHCWGWGRWWPSWWSSSNCLPIAPMFTKVHRGTNTRINLYRTYKMINLYRICPTQGHWGCIVISTNIQMFTKVHKDQSVFVQIGVTEDVLRNYYKLSNTHALTHTNTHPIICS